MITYTSEQVINKAAGDLGKWVPGEALGSVEYDTISAAFDNVLSEISKIVAINDRDEVPAFLYEAVASMTAAFAASSFSNQAIDYTGIIEPLERRIRYLVAQQPTYEILAGY